MEKVTKIEATTSKKVASSAAAKIRRAADASRKMSSNERAEIMVKAGLVSRDQVDGAIRNRKGDKR